MEPSFPTSVETIIETTPSLALPTSAEAKAPDAEAPPEVPQGDEAPHPDAEPDAEAPPEVPQGDEAPHPDAEPDAEAPPTNILMTIEPHEPESVSSTDSKLFAVTPTLSVIIGQEPEPTLEPEDVEAPESFIPTIWCLEPGCIESYESFIDDDALIAHMEKEHNV